MSRVGKSRNRTMIRGCLGLGWGPAEGGWEWELEGAMVKCHEVSFSGDKNLLKL